MRRSVCLLMACLMAAIVATSGCGPAATEVDTATPVPDTERPEATATLAPTDVSPTEEPTATAVPTEVEPSPTGTAEPSPTATPEPEQPTAPPPTATPEPTEAPTESEGQVLLEERCTVCHSLDLVKNRQKSREEWVTTVETMIGRGAELSEDEKQVLVDYLAETYGP